MYHFQIDLYVTVAGWNIENVNEITAQTSLSATGIKFSLPL